MLKYRINQVLNNKSYPSGRLYDVKDDADREAALRLQADRDTGEYRTSYVVVKVWI